MQFSSLIFLLYFLPTLFLCYFLIPARFRGARNFVLLAFSLFFYRCGGARHLPLLLVSIAVNYCGGLLAAPEHSPRVRRIGLWGAVAVGLGLLGWYKYAGFFAANLSALGLPVAVPRIVLPIGISFFTFQGLSYVVDVYRGDAACQRNPLYVALYVALFPQLVAGPIVRYTTVEEEITCRRESLEEFSRGVIRFCFGLGKKMLLANAMGEIADTIFAQPAASLDIVTAWVGAAAYTLQIYYDFSAYSDMAIGLGQMFGFHFLENFDYPYIARSVKEFWRRWHISLSTWFRDYVYIPLGGSRCSARRSVVNLLAVWLLTGLWHGANWTFVLWGLWFGALLLGERWLWGGVLECAPRVLCHAYTLLAVMLSWVLFRANDLGYALGYLHAMFGGGSGAGRLGIYSILEFWPEWIVGIAAAYPWKRVLAARLTARGDRLSRAVLTAAPAFLALGLLGLSYIKLVAGSFNPFIYFQF